MAVKDKLGRSVPSIPVYNRTDTKFFKDKAPDLHNMDVREEFPVYGLVEVPAGKVVEVPAEVAERWTEPGRWSKMGGWPIHPQTGEVVGPITKTIPAAKLKEIDPTADTGGEGDDEKDKK